MTGMKRMDAKDSFPVRRSIRTRLLFLLLGLTTASVVIIAYLGVSSILRMGQDAQVASNATLRAQAEEYLVRLTANTAEQNDRRLQQVRQDARNVATFAANIYEQPDAFAVEEYWRAQDRMFLGPEGQYINGEGDASTVFVPNDIVVDDDLTRSLELSAYLDLMFAPVYESDPDTVAIYFISHQEFSRLYPNINLGAILPPDFKATEDIFFTSGAPESNPDREVVWTPIYDDPAGQGLLVTAVAPVYSERGEFLGIVGIDVSLAELSANIEAASPIAGGYSFLVNEQGRAIALPERGYEDILGRSREPGEYGADLTAETSAFGPILGDMAAGSTGFQSVALGDREVFVAYAPMSGTKWSLANVVEAEEMLQAIAILQEEFETSTQALIWTRIVPAGAAILVLVAIVGLLLTGRLVNPLRSLASAAQQIGAGRWDVPLPPVGKDEIGLLAKALDTMTTQIRELVAGLEARVAERTQELERRSAYLEASAEVGRAAISVLDPDQLIRQTVHLIREHFGLYYVGLFLTDEASDGTGDEWAILRAGTGEAGRAMLARGHRIRVGSGMVGWAIANAQWRVAPEVGDDAVRMATPELPDTRAEAALPLRSRGQVLGALTVQDTRPGVFDEDAMVILQILGDQVAVALDNARLFAASQEALAAERLAYGEVSRDAWTQMIRLQSASGYRCDERGVFLSTGSLQPEGRQSVEGRITALTDDGERPTAAVPILVRGHVIGVLNFRKAAENDTWTREEVTLLESLAERLGQALEGARLYQESQRRAAQEQLVGEVTARMRETLDVDTVLQTAARELRTSLNLAEVEVRVGGGPVSDQA
jgi:GAF domain-containing protein/HAMP domain-containing protein